MNTPHSFAAYLNDRQASLVSIAHACAVYVGVQSDALTPEDMYSSLIHNAQSAAGVDQMLYQLEGDREYCDKDWGRNRCAGTTRGYPNSGQPGPLPSAYC